MNKTMTTRFDDTPLSIYPAGEFETMEEQKERTRRERHERRKESRRGAAGAKRFGDDPDLDEHLANYDPLDDPATVREIWESCCVHSLKEWMYKGIGVVFFGAAGYLFLVGMALVGSGAKVMSGCLAGELLGSSTNPLTNLMLGILATVLMQSSSLTTAVLVSLVEVRALTVGQAIFILMGANFGTTMTSSIVCMGHVRSLNQLERAFRSAATHDMFNTLTVLVLFPLECATGYLDFISSAVVEGAETGRPRDHWEGPVKKIVSPLVKLIIISDNKVIQKVALGAKRCDSFYPTTCDPEVEPSYETCKTGLIACNKKTNKCPMFFREGATREQDQISGTICFFLGVVCLLLATTGLIHALQRLLFGMPVKVVNSATQCNGYISIAFGAAVTMLVESSSTVTSFLVPFGGLGIIRIEQLYPIVVGANLGTSMTSVFSSLDSLGRDPLQVSLAGLFFNLTGFLLWYPLPPLRDIPIAAAQQMGAQARQWRLFPLVYIVGAFFLLPLFFMGLSVLFTIGTTGGLVGGIILTIVAAAALVFIIYSCRYRNGWEVYVSWLQFCERKTCSRGGGGDDGTSSAPGKQTKGLEGEGKGDNDNDDGDLADDGLEIGAYLDTMTDDSNHSSVERSSITC